MTMRALVVAFVSLLAGCAAQTLDVKTDKSYTVGQRLDAPVGGTLLTVTGGTTRVVRPWVGILNSPDGLGPPEQVRSQDYLRRELIYSGISGKTIELSFREYRGGLAAPAFYQSVKYDLGESSQIVFQNFTIDVLKASNARIEAVLVGDGTSGSPPPPPTPRHAVPAAMGPESYRLERLPEVIACNPSPRALVISKTPGIEIYGVACTNGDTLTFRCEVGSCRALK